MKKSPSPKSESVRSEGLTRSVHASLFEYLHACPICFRSNLAHYTRVPSLFTQNEFIVYERCRHCGVVFRNPRLPPSERLQVYVDKILPASLKELMPRNQVHYAHILREINRLYPQGAARRLFDFGCGSGGFLLEAQKAGFEVMGLELNKDLASFVSDRYGFPVHQGLIDDASFADERFNIILSAQVFEHLLDPRQTLLDLKKHLVAPGFVLIEVPNQLAIKETLRRGATMDDSHLFYFSARALSFMLEDCGFEVLKVQEGVRFYRLLEAAQKWPRWLSEGTTALAASLQLKTGLSVLARLR